jgi:hypothetical protein
VLIVDANDLFGGCWLGLVGCGLLWAVVCGLWLVFIRVPLVVMDGLLWGVVCCARSWLVCLVVCCGAACVVVLWWVWGGLVSLMLGAALDGVVCWVWCCFVINGEFDPGSGRTLAACLTHASRTVKPLRGWMSGERVSNT